MAQFSTFGQFGVALEAVAARVEPEIHRSLGEIGEAVEMIAKAKIGEYQAAEASPGGTTWPAWQQLAEATQEDRIRQGYTPNDPLLRSGAARASIGHAVEDMTLTVGSPDEHLLFSEMGTVTEPPRPALGPALGESMPRNLEALADGVERAFKG